MRILVTGDRGRVGSALTAVLAARGDTVVGFDLADGHDTRDASALIARAEGCDAVVHLAAAFTAAPLGGSTSTSTDDVDVLSSNVSGMHNVLLAAAGQGMRRVVFTSSVQALGIFIGLGRPDYLPLDDAHPARPVGAYGVSKLISEQLCASFTDATGVPTVCLRPPAVLAADTYEAIRAMRRESPEAEWSPYWEYGAFIDAHDLAEAIAAALVAPLTGHHRLLVCAADISSAELDGRTLARQLLPDVPWRGGPEYDAEPFRALIDTSAAQALLGWSPRRRWRE
jgi:nucleoside-diphosphate-sugar epimerase